MTIIGYARVSTREQNTASQEAELQAAGATSVFVDHGESSRESNRPQWQECLKYLRSGDTLVFRALDRLAGSEKMAIDVLNDLGDRGVLVKSLTEPPFDTTTPAGRFLYSVTAALAQLRVDTIRENTKRGLAHARSQGRIGGRPTVMTPERVAIAVKMLDEGQPVAHIARVLGVGASSVSRALERHSAALESDSSAHVDDVRG